jgi:hypothetical protein
MPIIMKEVSTPVIGKLICSRCEKVAKYEEEFEEWLIYSNHCGYESIFGDGTIISVELCPQCIKEVLGEYLKLHEG